MPGRGVAINCWRAVKNVAMTDNVIAESALSRTKRIWKTTRQIRFALLGYEISGTRAGLMAIAITANIALKVYAHRSEALEVARAAARMIIVKLTAFASPSTSTASKRSKHRK